MRAKGRIEEVEQKHRSAEAALKGELEGVRREYSQQLEQYQRLERDCLQRDADAKSIYLRMDTLQVLLGTVHMNSL